MIEFSYRPDGEQLRRFMRSNAFFRGIRGPVGSGKSVGCAVEVFRRALQQDKGPDGIRRSRWGVVRNSYPELRTTTLNTWKDWFPEDVWGSVTMHPPPYRHLLKKGDVECEVLFLALDRPEDVKKLLSFEFTGIWINEARELGKTIVDACTMRVGRYPSFKDGGPSWYGIIADTNSPDDDHWWPIMAGEAPPPEWMSAEEAKRLVRPNDWEFFSQPGAMLEIKGKEGETTGWKLNPKRENQKNMVPDYYPRIIEGKGNDWIKVYVGNQLGSIADGKPVYANFNRLAHVARGPLEPVPGHKIVVGIDFGLTPAAIFGQPFRSRWSVLRELVAQDMGASEFSREILRFIASEFPGLHPDKDFVWFGDPAGDFRAQTDKTTPFQVMRAAGIPVRAAPSNDVALRIEAVNGPLTRMVEGQPAFQIDERCVNLIRGFESGYHYRRLQVSGGMRYENEPSKNKFSHPHDAQQYMMLGGGEARNLLNGQADRKPANGRVHIDVFDRQKRPRRESRFS